MRGADKVYMESLGLVRKNLCIDMTNVIQSWQCATLPLTKTRPAVEY